MNICHMCCVGDLVLLYSGEYDVCDVTLSVYNRPVAQLAEHWASIPKIVGLIPIVDRHFFKLARCGYTLRVTSDT